jgi:hypothetical protein
MKSLSFDITISGKIYDKYCHIYTQFFLKGANFKGGEQ